MTAMFKSGGFYKVGAMSIDVWAKLSASGDVRSWLENRRAGRLLAGDVFLFDRWAPGKRLAFIIARDVAGWIQTDGLSAHKAFK